MYGVGKIREDKDMKKRTRRRTPGKSLTAALALAVVLALAWMTY